MELQTVNTFQILFCVILGGIIAVPALLANVHLAPRLGLIDWPKARGVAEEQIPIIGHALVIISLVSLMVLCGRQQPWLIWTGAVMAVMGFLDDRRPVSAMDKIFLQLVCVCSVVFLDPHLQSVMTEKYGGMGTFWAVFFILGLTNAINFVDGIDGLAGLVILLGGSGYVFYGAYCTNDPALMLFSGLMVGMMVPFLYLNVVKRKGFLGNVGSYFFAYVLAVMHLSLPLEISNPFSRVCVSGLAFLIPIADGSMVTCVRLMSLRSPFTADKGHLHHRLVQTSLPLRHILLVFGVLELLTLVLGTVLVANAGNLLEVLPPLLCVSQVAIVALLILIVDKGAKKRLQFYFQKLDHGESVYFMKYVFTRVDGNPITPLILRRLEAKVGAEIRISDLCYAEGPNKLFVSLRADPLPVKAISDRLESIFKEEQVVGTLEVEEGEFVKVSRASRKTQFDKKKKPRRFFTRRRAAG